MGLCGAPGSSHELRAVGSTTGADTTRYRPSNEGLGRELAMLNRPVEYLVDPSESLSEEERDGQRPPVTSTIERKDLVSHERHKDQGVLVTLFKDTNSTLTHKELLLVSEAVDKAGASEHVPLNEHTHCVCRVFATKEQATCFCKYQLQPYEKNETEVGSAKLDSVVDSMIRTGSKKAASNILKQYAERRRVAAENTIIVRQRLKQRIDAAQDMRSARVADEFANIHVRGAEYLKNLVAPQRNSPKKELDSNGLTEVDKKKALHIKTADDLRSTIAKLRDITAAIRVTRDETIARVAEYSQIDHRIEADLASAKDESSKLASAVHERALKALAKVKKEDKSNISGILGSMENETRPLLLRWLKMKQSKTIEEQSEKERLRIAKEKKANEEQKKRLDSAPTLEEVLKQNEQYKRLHAILEKRLEEYNKHMAKLEEDQKALDHRRSVLDEFRNEISPAEDTKLDEELQKRADVMERDAREQAYKRSKAAEASAKRRAAGLANDGRVRANIDVAAELRKLQTMRQKLQIGREELEKEVERRWANGPGHQNEGHGCVLCKATEEIEKLEDAKNRLSGDLKLCRADPNKFEPGCEEDLVFQITRLREEVSFSYFVLNLSIVTPRGRSEC